MNCTKTCPKVSSELYLKILECSLILIVQGLNPGKAIAEIKKLLAGIADKGEPGLKVNLEIKQKRKEWSNTCPQLAGLIVRKLHRDPRKLHLAVGKLYWIV